MKRFAYGMTFVFAVGLAGAPARATIQQPLHRDSLYEQSLRYENSVDKAITPARALRWVRSMMGGHVDTREPVTEFRPIVNASETAGLKVLATVVYKF